MYRYPSILKKLFITICCFFVFFGSGCRQEYSNNNTRDGHVPLRGIVLSADENDSKKFFTLIKLFVIKNNLELEQENIMRNSMIVDNIIIRINRSTFIHVDNFLNKKKYHINMYSSEPEQIWLPIWNSFIEKMRMSFDSSQIETREFPTKEKTGDKNT